MVYRITEVGIKISQIEIMPQNTTKHPTTFFVCKVLFYCNTDTYSENRKVVFSQLPQECHNHSSVTLQCPNDSGLAQRFCDREPELLGLQP